ncbi:MAG: pseudouridine-5'-phosphate glycosidase, partial [Bacteroidota bacterium]
QTLAGMDVGFGRTRGYGEYGVYNVVFAYMEESVGRYAAKAAVRICEALISGEAYDLSDDIQRMRELREEDRLGPSTGSIVEEAEARNISGKALTPYLLNRIKELSDGHSLVSNIALVRHNAALAADLSTALLDEK